MHVIQDSGRNDIARYDNQTEALIHAALYTRMGFTVYYIVRG